MTKSASINIRIEPEIKSKAEELFSSCGITLSDAINIFIRRSLMEGRIPFDVGIPRYNSDTEAALKEAKAILEGRLKTKSYSSAQELFDDLGV